MLFNPIILETENGLGYAVYSYNAFKPFAVLPFNVYERTSLAGLCLYIFHNNNIQVGANGCHVCIWDSADFFGYEKLTVDHYLFL